MGEWRRELRYVRVIMVRFFSIVSIYINRIKVNRRIRNLWR